MNDDRRQPAVRSQTRVSKLLRRLGVLAFLFGAGWMFWIVALAGATLRAYSVPSSSMAPAIKPGDQVCVEVGPGKGPLRGEIWALHLPNSPPPGHTAVKRIIGLAGETVQVAGGKVLIDGTPLNEPYLSVVPTYTTTPITLGPNEFFVLGDNRNASNDSHIWGPASRDELVGRVTLRYWPLSRLGGP